MRVPFCDLGRESNSLITDFVVATMRVVQSGHFLYGGELEAFEHELAAWHGVKHAVGVASGTDAVEIALRAAHGEGPVWCTAMTAVPTVNAIEAAGCTPLLWDIDPVTRNSRPDGRLFVHLYGLASDPGRIAVEDCAHSMGATVGGRLAGTMGACGAISFYPTKNCGALGDGGAIVTNDDGIAARARRIRHYGFEDDGDVRTRGQNSRLSEIQAAFLRAKLPRVHGWVDRRRAIAARYTSELRGRVMTPAEPSGSRHAYHVYVIEHPERDRIRAGLEARGIGTMIHYPRAIHQYDRWKHLGAPGQFPNAERLAAQALSLPCYPYLSDIEHAAVIDAVRELT